MTTVYTLILYVLQYTREKYEVVGGEQIITPPKLTKYVTATATLTLGKTSKRHIHSIDVDYYTIAGVAMKGIELRH